MRVTVRGIFFSGAVTLSTTGLPTGATASFAVNPVQVGTAGTSTNLVIWIPAGTTPSDKIAVSIDGTAGTLHNSHALSLTVKAATAPTTISNRSTYFYTEGDLQKLVYDAKHKLVFAANQKLSQVEVFSTETRQRLAPIIVPQPHSMDISPDNNLLWVGTLGEYLYAIDTEKRVVVKRVTPPRTDPMFARTVVRDLAVTSNGSLLLRLGEVQLTSEGLYQYFPSTGTFIERRDAEYGGPIAVLLRSADGSKVLVAEGYKTTLYDAATDSFVQNSLRGNTAIRPDGQQVVVVANGKLNFLDAQLKPVGESDLTPGGIPMYSADGRYVYMPDNTSPRRYPRILVVDAETFAILGDVPDPIFSPDVPECDIVDTCGGFTLGGTTLQAMDDSGLLIGIAPRGLSLVESTPILHLPPNMHRLISSPATTPPEGSPFGGTAVTLNGMGLQDAKVAFGKNFSELIVADEYHPIVLSPQSDVQGPVNLLAQFPDGWITLAANGFSYGPQIRYVVPAGGRMSGGGDVTIVGYGFGTGNPSETYRNSVSVQIGGRAAPVKYIWEDANSGQLAPTVKLVATIPEGTAGAQDVVVTTQAGSATAPKAFHYLQSVQDYTVPGRFSQVLYDGRRKLVYLLDSTNGVIQVFSTESYQLRSPITIGGNPQSMVLLPDGSRLAVANWNDTVTLVDPADASKRTVVDASIPNNTYEQHASTIGASADGKIFVGFHPTGYYMGTLRTIDLQSLAVNTVTEVCPRDYCYIESSKDGSRVFFAQSGISSGNVSSYDASTHMFTEERAMNDFLDEISAAGDGNRWLFNFHLVDSLNTIEANISPSPLVLRNSPSAVYGSRFHDSGGLYYLPLTNGLQIYDAQHGRLLRSYGGMAPTLSSRHTIALDETGATVFVITATGLEIVTLDSVPLSIGHVYPTQIDASVPHALTIRGSGFTGNTRAVVNGAEIIPEFVDANTLHVVTPALDPGAVALEVYSPDGDRFRLDNAVRVQ